MIPAGFTHPPGGNDFKNRSVLSYHYYQPPDIGPKPFINARMRDIKRLGVGGFLT
jgi:endoglycosylceramidase